MRHGYTLLSVGGVPASRSFADDLRAAVAVLDRAENEAPRRYALFLPRAAEGRFEHSDAHDIVYSDPLPC